MEKLNFKSCFIYNPSLKPEKEKPSDEEIQDAKLLMYYPTSEEIVMKRMTLGIIEGTMQYQHSFNNLEGKKNDFILTDLESSYYFSTKYEENYYLVMSIDKSNKELNLNENVNYRVQIFKEILNNFYKYFYLYHGSFQDFFFDKDDIRKDKEKYQNKCMIMTDFISCYFELFGDSGDDQNNYQRFMLDGMLYTIMPSYSDLLFTTLRICEKFKDILGVTLVYNGFIIHNEMDLETMSLLYNEYFNNNNGERNLRKFKYPLRIDEKASTVEGEVVEEEICSYSNFLKSFVSINPALSGKELSFNSKYLVGYDKKRNKYFTPIINSKEYGKIKLVVYYLNKLTLFLFFKENAILNNPEIFDQMAVYVDVCYSQKLEELKYVNFNAKIRDTSDEFDYVYYNCQNKVLRISNMFYTKNQKEFEPNKVCVLNKIKEMFMSDRIKKSITKFESVYAYYFEDLSKKVVIILKDLKTIEDVKHQYLKKLFEKIEYY